MVIKKENNDTGYKEAKTRNKNYEEYNCWREQEKEQNQEYEIKSSETTQNKEWIENYIIFGKLREARKTKITVTQYKEEI